MNKLIKDGQVAVVYTNKYGAGWSTANEHSPELQEFMIFDSRVVQAVLDNDIQKAIDIVKQEFKDDTRVYTDVDCLTVDWVPKGMIVTLHQHDGKESLDYYFPGGFMA